MQLELSRLDEQRPKWDRLVQLSEVEVPRRRNDFATCINEEQTARAVLKSLNCEPYQVVSSLNESEKNLVDSEILVCRSEEHLQALIPLVRHLELPYVPFLI